MTKKSKNQKRKDQSSKRQQPFIFPQNEPTLEDTAILILSAEVYENIFREPYFLAIENQDDEVATEMVDNLCQISWDIAHNVPSYEAALEIIKKSLNSEDFSTFECAWNKLIIFVALKKLFDEPYDPDFLLEEAEVVMTPNEIIEFRKSPINESFDEGYDENLDEIPF